MCVNIHSGMMMMVSSHPLDFSCNFIRKREEFFSLIVRVCLVSGVYRIENLLDILESYM